MHRNKILISSLIISSSIIVGCGRFFQKDDTRPDTSPYSSQFNSVVVFGDSLSDNGNIDFLTRGLKDLGIGEVFPVTPYHKGRFSNGLVWSERLMDDLKLGAQSSQTCFFNVTTNRSCNYAIGGSTTSQSISSDNNPFKKIKEIFNNSNVNDFLSKQVVPMHIGVKEMVTEYLNKDSPDDHALTHTLYIIWAGGNDYYADSNVEPTVANLIESIKLIINHNPSSGKRYFLIPNLPDLGNTPFIKKNPDRKEKLSQKTSQHNKILKEELEKLINNPDYKDKIAIVQLDIAKFFVDTINSGKDPATPINSTDTCYSKSYTESDGEVCKDPENYLFWDEVHPTQYAHCLIANFAEKRLTEEGLIQNLPLDKSCK
jgi:phospholipase/lecithinase/hemolysin